MKLSKLIGYLGLISPPPINKYLYYLSGVKLKDLKSTWIGVQVHIDNSYPNLVEIGSNVTISFGVKIFAHVEPPKTMRKEYFPCEEQTVVIGDDVSIGAGSLVLPGVKIGNYSVIGAGSVVVKDVPDFSVVAGNPARVIRPLTKIDSNSSTTDR